MLLCLLCSKPSFVFGFLLDSAFHCAYNRHMDFVRVSIEQLAKWHCQCEDQKRRIEADTIMDAYLKSGKSFDEIMTFLNP